MMKAKVDTAPMRPRSTRATSISGSVRASAMPRKPSPWKACTAMKPRLGSMRSPMRPEIGAVMTVMSGLMPRIHPVQRSVAGRVQRGHPLDVEGQAHVHERPREGAEQHRGRQHPGPGGRRHRQLRNSAAPERRASAVAAHVPAATSTMATTPSAAPGPRPTADCM